MRIYISLLLRRIILAHLRTKVSLPLIRVLRLHLQGLSMFVILKEFCSETALRRLQPPNIEIRRLLVVLYR
jgi:hypothetical protein